MRTYSAEQKAQIIARAQSGEPIKAIARETGVPRGTVQNWLRGQTPAAVLSPETREDLGALVYEYLATGLRTLIAQAREAGEAQYIKEQPADKLYLLHGTLADKLIALFGAIERGKSPDEEPESTEFPAGAGENP